MTSLSIRVPTDGDADAIAALINAHAMAVRGEPNITGQIVREWLAEPSIDVRIVYDGDDPVCYGDMIVVPSGTRASLDIREHPAHPGVAYMLLDAFEADAVIRGATESRAYSDPAETAYVALLQARGYQAIRSSFEMLVRLADAPGATPAPGGLEIRTRATGQERLMYDASTDSFRDHWSFEPRTYDEWARSHVESSSVDPLLQFLAWDGTDIAGVCLCAPHQSAQPGFGWVDILGVRAPWRRRGLALALLTYAFQEFRARGFDRVGLGVDGESTTGALELYERAGMHVDKQQDTFERQLPL